MPRSQPRRRPRAPTIPYETSQSPWSTHVHAHDTSRQFRPRRNRVRGRRAGNIHFVDDSVRGRHRRGLLAHQRPPDRGQHQSADPHRGRQLVRHGNEHLRASRTLDARLPLDDGPDEGTGLQHDPPALLQPAVRRRQHAQRHRLRAEPRSCRPQRPADHGQDRRLRRRDRPAHHARPSPSGRRRPVRTLVHRELRRGALDPRLDDARRALRRATPR